MPRLPRICPPGIPQHVIQRGVNRQACFGSDQDMAAYAFWLEESARKFGVAVHAWVFMTNHVHLLVTPMQENAVSKMMQTLDRQYVRYFNRTYRRSGTLWEGRFKSCVVSSAEYLLVCQRYIELNPVRAGMVRSPGAYAWSSYAANGLGKHIKLCTHHGEYLRLGRRPELRVEAYRALFSEHLSPETVGEIRKACNKGLALGNSRFKSEIAALSGRRIVAIRSGPRRESG